MSATAIPHSSLPLKATDTNQRAELTPVAMADFTFAIVVSLASPIQPVATSKHDTEYTLRQLLIGTRRVQNFMMVRVELGVNRSMEEFATPSSGASYPRCRAGRRASVGTKSF